MLKISPEKGGIAIASTESCTVSIYTPDGRQLLASKISSGTTRIDLEPGIYMVNSMKIAVR